MAKPLISTCAASNRPFLWLEFREKLMKYKKDVDFEMVFVGPNEPDFKLPTDINFIKTANIKTGQCAEIALKESQGEMAVFLGDDVTFWQAGFDDLYREHQRLCDEEGTHKIITLPKFKSSGIYPVLEYPKCRFQNRPYASLVGALIDKKLLKELKEPAGWLDQRFTGVYWDCDLAMRFNEAGVKTIKLENLISVEFFTPETKKTRIHQTCKPVDWEVLHSLWVRDRREDEKDEDFPTEDAYGPVRFRKPSVLSKKRLKSLMRFEDKDLLTKSQGPKSIIQDGKILLEWE